MGNSIVTSVAQNVAGKMAESQKQTQQEMIARTLPCYFSIPLIH